MPRTYRLGARAAQKDATRDRILDAAIELYAEFGISRTTMSMITARADVAPGTLRNHFSSREALDAAMVARLTAEAPLPELSIFEGATGIEERLRCLTVVTGAFFEQTARLQRMWLREPMLSPIWAERGAAYGGRWAQLVSIALGPLAEDPDAMTVIRAVLQPAFFESLRTGERTNEEVAALATALVTPWFVARLGTKGG